VQFLYDGFVQDGNNRCYSFKAVEEHQPSVVYSIWVDLKLFTKYQVPLQNGPMFCLHLVQTACSTSTDQANPDRIYRAVEADFAGLLMERAARATALASKKVARRPFRKPQPSSQLQRYVR
jgi:hypothetical protein